MITLASIKKETIGADFVREERLAVKTNKGRHNSGNVPADGFFSSFFFSSSAGILKRKNKIAHENAPLARQAIR